MARFSELRSGRRAVGDGTGMREDVARAVLTMPILVAAADGELTRAEIGVLDRACAANPVFRALGGERSSRMAAAIVAEVRAEGLAAVYNRAVGHLSPEAAEMALDMAMKIAAVGGRMSREEGDMMIRMGETMGIAQSRFLELARTNGLFARTAEV